MPSPTLIHECPSPEATERLAARIAALLRGGEVILLRGPLGAGKTFFAGALGRALGITEPLVSPTYVIHRPYETPSGLALHHLDFYRLEGDADLEPLGIDELTGVEAIVLAEWPERCPGAFAGFTLEIQFHVTGEETRRIEIRFGGLPFDRQAIAGELHEDTE